MIPRSPVDRGSADGAALAAALVLGAAAFVPSLLLRAREGGSPPIEGPARPGPAGSDPAAPASLLARALEAAAAARADLDRSPFRTDPSRRLGPAPAPAAPPGPPVPPSPAEGAGRVTDLDGRVVEGRLSVRWTPAPGSRATEVRVEGLGDVGPVEREVPAADSTLEIPVPATSGTVVVKALPLGLPAPGTEARVSIPYRIPVEVVRAERAHEDTGTAILRLRRAYDGRAVEADFALHEADPVGDLSSVVPGGPVIDFRTDLVLEEVREVRAAGPLVEVPLFGPDGRVERDGEGRPLTYGRASTVVAGKEVVLRGPDDARRIVPAE